jgi:hypothetical protein
MHVWVGAANDWSVAAQRVVESSTGLATASRELADVLAPNGGNGDGEAALPVELRRLAENVESDTAELRNRYLATAANIDEFKDFVD